MDVVTSGRSCQHRFCGNKGVWQTGVSWRYFLLRFLIGVVARSSVPDRRRGGYQSGRFRFQHALGYQSGLYGYSTPVTISLASGFQRVWKVKGIVYRFLSRCGGSKTKFVALAPYFTPPGHADESSWAYFGAELGCG